MTITLSPIYTTPRQTTSSEKLLSTFTFSLCRFVRWMILFMVSTIIWRRGKRRNVWKESCRVSRAMMLWWVVDFHFFLTLHSFFLHVKQLECPDTQMRWEAYSKSRRIVEAQLIEHPSTYLKFLHVFFSLSLIRRIQITKAWRSW